MSRKPSPVTSSRRRGTDLGDAVSKIWRSRFTRLDLPKISNKRRWSIVGLLFAASLINYLDRATISLALPLLSRDFQLTSQSKGLLLSSFFWSYALMQIPIGWSA